MKFSLGSALLLALAAQTTASSWFGKSVYNKWHETELERWLSDNDVPYPSPADRKDLENLIKNNWEESIVSPYKKWDTPQLNKYLQSKGEEISESASKNKDSLIIQAKNAWTDTVEAAETQFDNVKEWIFDSWTDSQLKAFCDKHGITVPQPRKRDTLLKTVRENYEKVAQKTNEAIHYPGNWLYATWSESDLKEFLDARGIPAPQPSTKDKLIAMVRRNSRLAAISARDAAASASASAAGAQATLSDALLDSWSDSKIKEWADKNGIKVPQGSKRNELIALARKHRASLLDDNVKASASSAFHAATTSAGNEYAKATDDAALKANDLFNQAVASWSDSRLKAYLDARGIPVPQSGKKDDLLAAVRLQAHKASTGYSAWTFDTWTTDNLKKWLATQNNKAAKQAGVAREELIKQANIAYTSASSAGGPAYATMTSYLAQQTDAAKDSVFDTWSDSDLKSYLDSYGIPVYQGTTTNELKAAARRSYNYFRYGTTTPSGTIFAKLQEGFDWVWGQLQLGAAAGRKEAGYQGRKAADAVKEGATIAANRAQEAAQQATDRVKEEL